VLIVTARVQHRIKPYKNSKNNQVEILAITAGIVTILSNLIYTEEQKVNSIRQFVLFITVILNIIFLSKWVHLL